MMSALARQRRARRAARVHAAMRGEGGANWRVVMVMADDGAGGEGRERARRHLASRGWMVALHREDVVDILVAATSLPGSADAAPEAQAVELLGRLATMIREEDPDGALTDGVRIDDLILIPPEAVDSDWDLLWLDPRERLLDAWGGPGGVAATLDVIEDLLAHWQGASRVAAGAPEIRSLSDELF